MNRKRVIIINLIMIGLIFLFVMTYSRQKSVEYSRGQEKSFEANVIAIEKITETYLSSEQIICDSWAGYINKHRMSMEDAIRYLRDSIVMDDDSCQILYADTDHYYGLSTSYKYSDGSNEVDYANIKILNDVSQINNDADRINITRAFTDPITGLQSLAFYDTVYVFEDGSPRTCVLMRLIPVSDLQRRWQFESGKYESVDYAILDVDGNYIIKDAGFKNNNFLEFYSSYNTGRAEDIASLKEKLEAGTGTFIMTDSKGVESFMAYTSIERADGWKLVSKVGMSEIVGGKIDWRLLVIVALAMVAVFIYDLSVMGEVNRTLKESAELAEAASKAKTTFLSSMSHDIRTPMNAISGMTAIAQKNIHDPIRVSDCLEKISMANRHLVTLVNDALDIGKIESGKIELANEDFSIQEVLDNLVNVLKPQMEAKNQHFQYDARIIQDYLRGDALRLSQIYINLLSNSIKYTQQDGHIAVLVSEEPSPRGEEYVRVIWSVQDDGMGMSEEFMTNMYTSFSREMDTRVNKIQGTGLGLAIVKQLVDIMGGTIECDSKLNQGTKFTVTLDLSRGSRKSQKANTISDKEDFDYSKIRILVAEDNAINWEIIHEMLSEYGIASENAPDGEACIDMLEKSEPDSWDMIFMDIQMPKLNGIETTKKIRKLSDPHKASIPIIAMTADAFAENVQQCLEVGMNGHVSKPIEMSLVLAQIRKMKEKNS